jgi:CHAT domain-containing protein
VEYFSFASEDPKKVAGKKDKRTVAYVVRRAGPIRLVDLGPTDAIERAVENARQALGPTARPADSALRALGELVVEPLLPSLKGARALRIAPDAALHRVPFSALRTQAGALLDQFSITYIGTGREWARLAESQGTQKSRSKAKRAADQKGASQLSPVIFANPDFGKKGTDAPEFAGSSPFTLATRGARSAEPLPHDWQPLPGTGKEARRLSQLFPQGRTFLHQEATETALKSVQHPDILHVASHGYFLPPDDGGGAEALAEDPLLHSGVVLAFANAGGRGVDDGFLTAFEVAGMDLGGTQIATLSACETGLGQVNGEGIFGLRRALAIAGAESQLLSLWKVDDDATLEFMSAFYQRVAQGESREDALLGVQRAMAAARPLSAQSSALAKKFQHPYFWSAFVLSGDPGTLPPPIDMKDAAGVASR